MWRLFVILGNAYRRFLAVLLAVIGPRAAYRVTRELAGLLYRNLSPLQTRFEQQYAAALGRGISREEIARAARSSFIHRMWNLTDLMLAERLLHPHTFEAYGGQIGEPYRGLLLLANRKKQPVILVTAYYGPFDLLPIFLGYNGIGAGVVYRTHPNVAFDEYRQRIRARGGCEMIPVEQAVYRLPQILESGGTVAILADHHADRRGLPVTFLGRPTTAMRTVGLLACAYQAIVVVAGIRRLRESFHFDIVVADIMHPRDWTGASDPVAFITNRYLRGLETIILRDPVQYPWGYDRWG